MNHYRVYFDQVNQTYIDVEARTLESAMLKAEREWKQDNQPHLSYVEKEGKEIFPREEKDNG